MAKKKKLILTIIGAFLLYLASTGVAYATFRFIGKPFGAEVISPLPEVEGGLRVDLSAPKTEECPLNGGMFTKEEKKIWEVHRPITVMIENHEEARPQSGLSRADVVYEAVAEGAITRFLAVFYCGVAAQDVIIGPVRSARIYYLDFASEYGDYPLYAHVGGANDFAGTGETDPKARALETIANLGWQLYNDLDASSLSFPVFWRDYERIGHPVATEHTMYSTTDRLWEVAHKRGLDAEDEEGNQWDKKFEFWSFKDDKKADQPGEVTQIEFEFWRDYQAYAVTWQYNQEDNSYLRVNGGQPHQDLNNDEQIKAKVVIIQFTKEQGPIDANKHMLYTTLGKGQAIIFQDGEAIKGTWQKAKRESRTKFLDSRGQEIELNRGPVWIEIIPAQQEVNY